MVGRPCHRAGSGRKDLPKICEALLEVHEWSEGPPGGPKLFGRPYYRSGSGWEALLEVQE